MIFATGERSKPRVDQGPTMDSMLEDSKSLSARKNQKTRRKGRAHRVKLLRRPMEIECGWCSASARNGFLRSSSSDICGAYRRVRGQSSMELFLSAPAI